MSGEKQMAKNKFWLEWQQYIYNNCHSDYFVIFDFILLGSLFLNFLDVFLFLGNTF